MANPVTPPEWRVFGRAPDRTNKGMIGVWDKLSMVLRHNTTSTWNLSLKADHKHAKRLVQGGGIKIYGPNSTTDPILNGPIETIAPAFKDGKALLDVFGICDLGQLGDRICLPDPTSAMDAQDSEAYDNRSGVAETVIRQLIDLNAATGAVSGRPIPGLVVGSTTGLGTAVKSSVRFDNLLEVVTELAYQGGLTIGVVQQDDDLVLVVDAMPDTPSARFSETIRNLTEWAYKINVPKGTVALVAGQGQGELRTLVKVEAPGSAEADWNRRREIFVDARDTDDNDLLNQRGLEKLAEVAATAGLSITPTNVKGMAFGKNYQLGDLVMVETGGVKWVERVTAVKIDVTADKVVISPIVGSEELGSESPILYSLVRTINKRLGRIERRQ